VILLIRGRVKERDVEHTVAIEEEKGEGDKEAREGKRDDWDR
jgi:hypothetical protein